MGNATFFKQLCSLLHITDRRLIPFSLIPYLLDSIIHKDFEASHITAYVIKDQLVFVPNYFMINMDISFFAYRK